MLGRVMNHTSDSAASSSSPTARRCANCRVRHPPPEHRTWRYHARLASLLTHSSFQLDRAAVYLAAGSLYILGTPEGFHHGRRSRSLLAAGIYLNAPELWLNPADLPPHGWSFADFRRALIAWYKPFDNHSDSSGATFQTLTGAAAAAGLAALVAASPAGPTGFQRRLRSSADRSTKGPVT